MFDMSSEICSTKELHALIHNSRENETLQKPHSISNTYSYQRWGGGCRLFRGRENRAKEMKNTA